MDIDHLQSTWLSSEWMTKVGPFGVTKITSLCWYCHWFIFMFGIQNHRSNPGPPLSQTAIPNRSNPDCWNMWPSCSGSRFQPPYRLHHVNLRSLLFKLMTFRWVASELLPRVEDWPWYLKATQIQSSWWKSAYFRIRFLKHSYSLSQRIAASRCSNFHSKGLSFHQYSIARCAFACVAYKLWSNWYFFITSNVSAVTPTLATSCHLQWIHANWLERSLYCQETTTHIIASIAYVEFHATSLTSENVQPSANF